MGAEAVWVTAFSTDRDSTHMLAEKYDMADLWSPTEKRFATNIRAAWKWEEFVAAIEEAYTRQHSHARRELQYGGASESHRKALRHKH